MATATKSDLAAKVEQVLREALGGDRDQHMFIPTVLLGDKLHMVVISEALNGLTARKRQTLLWGPLKEALDPEELQRVSAVVAFGTEDFGPI
jgi:acid stress-induced BolA-like protein IbaG/YrbA